MPNYVLSEYTEASTVFFRGVDIGINFMKIFFVINAGLIAAVQLKSDPLIANSALSQHFYLAFLAYAGVSVAAMLFMIVPYYHDQLQNAAKRCQELEAEFGGALYRQINTTNKIGYSVKPALAIRIISGMAFAGWAIVFYRNVNQPSVLAYLQEMLR